MQVTKNSPDAFIKSLPEADREIMQAVDKAIRKGAPKLSRVMWEGKFWGGTEQKIIGYGDLTYINSKKEEVKWHLLGLAKQKNYFTLYVMAADGNKYLLESYKGKLGKAKSSKSAINFKNLEEIDLKVIEEIARESVKLANNS